MRKANVLFLVLTISMIVFCGISYAAVAGFINVGQPNPAETRDVKTTVEDAVRNEGKPIASNATLLTTDLIDKLNGDATAVVTLNGQAIAVPGVTDQKAYAIGLGSVRLAQVVVKGNAYDFSDTTINPLLFSDDYAVSQTAALIPQIDALTGDQIAVIVAITRTPEEIAAIAGIKERIDAGKVIIVQATNPDSRGAFTDLFKTHPEGFALRSIDKTDVTVVKALQGAV